MSAWLILIAVAAPVPWTVVPDGPQTFAVVKDYGGADAELRICREVPREADAQRIAEFLNNAAR